MASAMICPICSSWLAEHFGEFVDDGVDGVVDAAFDLRGVGAGGDVFESFGED
jgi:hypothetical protein